MSQQLFNPTDFGNFRWTDDWFEWNSVAGHTEARKARDARAAELRAAGHKRVRKFTLRNQVVSRGGLGSGHAHVQFVVTAFGLNY